MTASYGPDAAYGEQNGCGLSIEEISKCLCAILTSSTAYGFTRIVHGALGLDVDSIVMRLDSHALGALTRTAQCQEAGDDADGDIIGAVLGTGW